MTKTEPTITLYLWHVSTIPEYWWSTCEPVGVPTRCWYEPIEDEL